ncbi:MAG: hypothetical protein ACJASX_003556 [Limisphaerales bacterium]|jgi:hypothetical protein
MKMRIEYQRRSAEQTVTSHAFQSAINRKFWSLSDCGMIRMFLLALNLIAVDAALAQQAIDTKFAVTVSASTYAQGQGPIVAIDEAHHNYHTAGGRYAAFADLLSKDGYRVRPSGSIFSKKRLKKVDVLVIANALHESNKRKWTLPTPSAFSDAEIRVVRDWVKQGGSLLLIADHMPFPGAAAELGREFGFAFGNGYASGPAEGVFRKSDGLLKEHAITSGRSKPEAITAVRTFTGQAFQATKEVAPLIVFGAGHSMRLPKRANRFDTDTPSVKVDGWLHAGARKFGKGRVVVFGEAAMFSAQLSGTSKRPMGMNAPGAEQNKQLCLNVLHWLSGLLEPENTKP